MDLRNYRPVTVLTAIAKGFEHLLSAQVASFIERYLSKTMTVYRKTHGYETALPGQVEKWKTESRWKEIGRSSLYWHVQSVRFTSFPVIHYQIESLWFFRRGARFDARSYFWERKYKLRIDPETSSEWYETSRGCLQGSFFGPLLWNVAQTWFALHSEKLFVIQSCTLTTINCLMLLSRLKR